MAKTDAKTHSPAKLQHQSWLLPMGVIAAIAVTTGYFGFRYWKIRTVKELALAAEANLDWDKLAQLTEIWCEWQPTDADAKFLAGLAAEQRGSHLQALQIYESVPPQYPQQYSRARTRLALLALAADSPRDVESYLQQALQADATNSDAWREWLRYLGLTYQQSLARKEALKSIEIGADTPASFVYLMATDLVMYSDGEAKTLRWAEDDPSPKQFEIASLLHAIKRASLSETPDANEASVANDGYVTGQSSIDKRFAELSVRYPTDLELSFLQIERAFDSGEFDRMSQLLSELPKAAADDPRSWRLRGQWLQMQDRTDEAITAYKTAIEKNPFDTRPYQFLAEIARLNNDQAESNRLQQTATTGNAMRRMVYTAKSIDQLDRSVFEAMAEFAKLVGQTSVAQRLQERLQELPRS